MVFTSLKIGERVSHRGDTEYEFDGTIIGIEVSPGGLRTDYLELLEASPGPTETPLRAIQGRPLKNGYASTISLTAANMISPQTPPILPPSKSTH